MTSKTIIDLELGVIHIHVSKLQRREHEVAERKKSGAWKRKEARKEAKLVKMLAKKKALDGSVF
jgi:hypothetical protein